MIKVYDLMIVENEHLYGPGKRLLLFLKGCSIHCDGCVNKHLWSFDSGKLYHTKEIIDICDIERVDGITIHGGEPLDQAEGLLKLVKDIKNKGLTIVLFTGYIKKELKKTQKNIWDKSDIVIAGRFDIKKRNTNLQFRGSTNQRIYTHEGKYKNYKVKDGHTTAILTINSNGYIDINGFLTEDIEELVGEKQ